MDKPRSGWVAFTPQSLADMPEGERRQAERLLKDREAARGDLLAVVEVRVYEREAHPQVSFPPDSRLGPEAEPDVVAEVVARAREELGRWR
jgi:hypothetical protein